jgi:acyl dehydratase
MELAPGTDLGVSDWHEVTQQDINAFATLTRDEDDFHINPEFAREHSPVGTSISFGFLTMSMLTYFSHQVFDQMGIRSSDHTQMFNFGFDRVRMPEPVPAGSRIRGRFTFAGARVRESGGLEITVDVIVDIDGNDRPALVAEWLFVAVRGSNDA